MGTSMFHSSFFCLVMAPLIVAGLPRGSVQPAEDLLDRVLPGAREHFQLSLVDQCVGSMKAPCYQLADAGDKIAIGATGMSELTSGIGFYLREYCNMTIGWARGGGSNIFMPKKWPKLGSGAIVKKQRNVPWSYMMNVCTHSYSLVWYDWSRWQAFIDWMALSGINNVLALTGQEEIQYKVFSKLGLSDAEIRDWFNGPALLTWSRGQNEYGAGIAGPLPRSWMKNQWLLQKKILTRYRELGIVGQLPGFQGNVPVGLKAIKKDANITVQGATGWLDSLDPLFGEVADMWMKTLVDDFGTDSWYQLDGYFNGGTAPWLSSQEKKISKPPLSFADFPVDKQWAARGAAAYEGLNRTDPNAMWSFQGFAFEFWPQDVKHASWLLGFISAVPKGRFSIVDMDYTSGEWHKWNNSAFFGTKFIWSALHNFGGTDGIKGNLTRVSEMPFAAQEAGANVWGTGFTAEGIDQNPAFYDFLIAQPWQQNRVSNIPAALSNRAHRRYGLSSTLPQVSKAWSILYKSMYNQDGGGVQDSTGVAHLPGKSFWDFLPDKHTPGQALCQTFRAWTYLVSVAPHITLAEPFRYDLVNLGRDVLARLTTPVSNDFYDAAFPTQGVPDAKNVSRFGTAYLDLLTDLNDLVATDSAFLLGSWLSWARSFADGATDCFAKGYPVISNCADFYEWNARVQITSWNPTPKGAQQVPGGPIDYAAKHWNGLIGGYYKERANRLMKLALEAADKKQALDPAAAELVKAQYAYEWTTAFDEKYPEEPVGDAVAVSQQLLHKYSPAFDSCAQGVASELFV